MPYTINEYYKYLNSKNTRAEVYSDNTTAANLLALHKDNGGIVEISIYDCIEAASILLPMPTALMVTLDEKIRSEEKRVIITGIDSYLSLLNEDGVSAFMTALKVRIDEGKLNASYLVCKNRFDKTKFSNPKYEHDLYIAYIGNTSQQFSQPMVNIVSEKWVSRGNNPANWNSLLKALDKFEPIGEHTLVMDNFSSSQAGLSNNVSQLIGIADIAKLYYNISAGLPVSVLETLITKCKNDNVSPNDYIKAQFGYENVNERLAVKRLLELRGDNIWSAYVWFLKNTINGSSYLAKVLSAEITSENLLKLYVCDTAIIVLSNENAKEYAKERASTIKELGNIADSLIIDFISKSIIKSDQIVACWLNCGTEAERIEIIRRVSESDLTTGLPQIWHNLYPLLTDYLSDKYDYTNKEITMYFRDYRRMKIADMVTEDFVKRAFDIILPSPFTERDSLLQDLSIHDNTAILIVDGMGAEYFPLILAMAERKGMNIESAAVATVKLPTSTDFNRINWHNDKVLNPINRVDTISHEGAAKNEKCSPAHNIVATFDVFESIFNSIANGLTKFEKVIVTSDHGSSRLAVIAHKEKMIENIQWNKPLDWRFTFAPQNKVRPDKFEAYYDAENNITYWIVRGYNRLTKEGGKLSVHGGATLEERLVPVVVFTKNKTEPFAEQISEPIIEQIVEKMDFDI